MRQSHYTKIVSAGLFALFYAAGFLHPAKAEPLGDPQIMISAEGVCDPTTHTTEGPLGSDLTKFDVPFRCDAVVISNFANNQSWVLVQFSDKEAIAGGVLGFSGELDGSGTKFFIQHIYFPDGGPPLDADAGLCNIIFDGNNLAAISCTGKADEDGRRAVALVNFRFIPEQPPPGQ
jgi:hypothetical protein